MKLDLPLVSKETLHYLLEGSTQIKAAIVAKSDERVQPLLGSLQTRLALELENYLSSGKRAVMDFIDEIDYETFRVDDEEIANINTPEEYKIYFLPGDVNRCLLSSTSVYSLFLNPLSHLKHHYKRSARRI